MGFNLGPIFSNFYMSALENEIFILNSIKIPQSTQDILMIDLFSPTILMK